MFSRLTRRATSHSLQNSITTLSYLIHTSLFKKETGTKHMHVHSLQTHNDIVEAFWNYPCMHSLEFPTIAHLKLTLQQDFPLLHRKLESRLNDAFFSCFSCNAISPKRGRLAACLHSHPTPSLRPGWVRLEPT